MSIYRGLIKSILMHLPGVRILKSKITHVQEQVRMLENENMLLAKENIDLRLKIKNAAGEKINVVFVCHRPAVWESLHSVYDAMAKDENFNVTIVAIPNKKELPEKWLNHEEYASEGAEEFWREYGCINGYNYETREWIDLSSFNPDYIFFQQPYNITRFQLYNSRIASKYAKIAFVPYGVQIIGGEVFESVHPHDFMENVSFYFCTDSYLKKDLDEWLRKDNNYFTKTIVTGFPRYDQLLLKSKASSDIWRFQGESKKFRIIWTPRWCTNEGLCSFFEYKDKILDYAYANRETIEIVFRPHPQAFSEWNTTGELPEIEQQKFRAQCDQSGIIIDEDGEYVSKIISTDCFLTDATSLLAEYLVTDHPIIYCYKKDCFTSFGDKLKEAYYYAYTWDDINEIISQLINGVDPKQEVRREILANQFYFPDNGAGECIKQVILDDARK